MNVETVLATDPEVTPISDPRLQFYLDNQRLIETWCRLRSEAQTAIHERLLELSPTLSADAEQLGITDVFIGPVDEDSGTPRLQIVRRNWIGTADSSPVAVVIEWHRTLIDSQGSLQLYVGLRSKLSHERAEELSEPLARLGAEARSSLGKPWQSKKGRYPLWRWIRPETDSLDVMATIAAARRELWMCCRVVVPQLDQLLSQPPA